MNFCYNDVIWEAKAKQDETKKLSILNIKGLIVSLLSILLKLRRVGVGFATALPAPLVFSMRRKSHE